MAESEDDSAHYGLLNGDTHGDAVPAQAAPTRSIYAMTRSEITRGIANRFVHSRTYILLYIGMAALSTTTVVLSLVDGCPGLAFYILEFIINTAMICEVGIRFVAFGRQFWKSPFNVFDLVVTAFCALTLLVIVFAGCGATSKEEEILDTLLLTVRNVLQSGHSIFSRPKPIDLRNRNLDIDLEDDDIAIDNAELGRSLLFEANEQEEQERSSQGRSLTDMPRAAQAVKDRDTEDVWAELG
ncbi:hypothetical protein PUNSTDRAFT_129645 [Punctularia strigosozonata HHB-11173 SS5]|uniref:uncharacterized protein n=1 Tax=Punctularia strigosozonata (strain HHB-11173) TaxID=741275 RepID=UPI0004417D16|nr:uncharacterized protein PUNSTDRAFT_129645 [Punctularia strigosozonata HHB-11173 SS5]EIN13993.1 hypothetical protein PUNSTDRAFT_129645 [Punctularia strigosozonata HHB-11173 SS5]